MAQGTKSSPDNPEPPVPSQTILESLTVTDSDLALTILHGKKKMILQLLLEKSKTIQDIKKETGLNPGTIKRHILDLISNELIFMDYEKQSEPYNIWMKFYRAKAKKIRIDITLSSDTRDM